MNKNKRLNSEKQNKEKDKIINFNKKNEIFEEENKERAERLLNLVYEVVDKTKFDPVLRVFGENEILKEFYFNRIIELITVK